MSLMDKDENRIVLFGGSFNPIHNGHIAIAKAAAEEFSLDEVVLLPNKITYYKEHSDKFLSDEARVDMLKLVAKFNPFLSVNDMEIRRGGVTKTIDTVDELLAEDSDRKIYLIIGTDSFAWIDKWVEADRLLRNVSLIVAMRQGMDETEFDQKKVELISRFPELEIYKLGLEKIDISSSEIRSRIKKGEPVKGLLPEYLIEYIVYTGIYDSLTR